MFPGPNRGGNRRAAASHSRQGLISSCHRGENHPVRTIWGASNPEQAFRACVGSSAMCTIPTGVTQPGTKDSMESVQLRGMTSVCIHEHFLEFHDILVSIMRDDEPLVFLGRKYANHSPVSKPRNVELLQPRKTTIHKHSHDIPHFRCSVLKLSL
jgi:hypothetical protein